MRNREEELYTVRSSEFLGGDEKHGYTYKITFNKSLVHTGKFSGIEDGLNDYDRRQQLFEFRENARRVWGNFKRYFQRKKRLGQ